MSPANVKKQLLVRWWLWRCWLGLTNMVKLCCLHSMNTSIIMTILWQTKNTVMNIKWHIPEDRPVSDLKVMNHHSNPFLVFPFYADHHSQNCTHRSTSWKQDIHTYVRTCVCACACMHIYVMKSSDLLSCKIHYSFEPGHKKTGCVKSNKKYCHRINSSNLLWEIFKPYIPWLNTFKFIMWKLITICLSFFSFFVGTGGWWQQQWVSYWSLRTFIQTWS
jgi:hypothetical protein